MFSKLCAIAVFTFFILMVPARAEGFPGHFVPANPPVELPDFVFVDAGGHELRLSDFRGHAVLLNLWATWCGPCVKEMPSLDRLQAELKAQNLVVIALDQEHNGADAAASFFKRHEIRNLALYSDPSVRASSILHAPVLPMSFLIDADGKMNGSVAGGTDWSTPEMIAFIRSRVLGRTSESPAIAD